MSDSSKPATCPKCGAEIQDDGGDAFGTFFSCGTAWYPITHILRDTDTCRIRELTIENARLRAELEASEAALKAKGGAT